MNTTNRITLSNSVFAGRIKKFDSYSSTSPLSSQMTGTITRVRNAPKSGITRSNKVVPVAKVQPLHKIGSVTQSSFKSQLLPASGLIALQSVKRSVAAKESILADQFAGSDYFTRGHKKKMTKSQKITYGIGLAVFIFACAVSVQTMLTNMQTKEQISVLGESQSQDSSGVAEGSGDKPTEEKPSDTAIFNYQVNPEDPRYLRIPELGVFARIKTLGRTPEGAVDAPWNIYDVGWYRESARPGNSRGSSLLLGHVSGWTAPGVFKRIGELKAGSRFEVEKGSGQKIQYEVTKTENIPVEKINMAKVLGTEVAGEHDLKLMTCSGRFDREADHYTERMIVYAKVLRN